MADQEVDPAAMAADADALGRGGSDVVDAADALILARRLAADAFGTSPASGALADFCTVWLGGTESMGSRVAALADYTQRVANAFGAVDRKLEATYTPVRDESELPPVAVDNLDPDSPYYNPYIA